jgi:hypothetical protein
MVPKPILSECVALPFSRDHGDYVEVKLIKESIDLKEKETAQSHNFTKVKALIGGVGKPPASTTPHP